MKCNKFWRFFGLIVLFGVVGCSALLVYEGYTVWGFNGLFLLLFIYGMGVVTEGIIDTYYYCKRRDRNES